MWDKLCYPPPSPAVTKLSSTLRRLTEQGGRSASWNEGSYGTIAIYNSGDVRKRNHMTISLGVTILS